MSATTISDLAGTGLVYLATPFSRYKHGQAAAYSMACVIAARMMAKGVAVYSPIAHGYGIALHAREDGIELSEDDSDWAAINLAVLGACDVMVIADMDGWAESDGIRREVVGAHWQMPIYVMDKDGNLSGLPDAHLDQEDGA